MPATLAELAVAKHQRALLLKPLEARVFMAPMSVAVPAAITDPTDSLLAELPAGWVDVGLILEDDAITWSRQVEKADIRAIGYRDPVRSDITSDVTGLAFTALETNRYSLERYTGLDLSGVTPITGSGEIVVDQVAAPVRRNRYLAIARDGVGADTIFVGRCLTAGEVADVGEQTWTTAEGAMGWPTTLNGVVDTGLSPGVAVRHYFGGPGWKALLEDAGFPAVTP